jgi:hypothetical protein
MSRINILALLTDCRVYGNVEKIKTAWIVFTFTSYTTHRREQDVQNVNKELTQHLLRNVQSPNIGVICAKKMSFKKDSITSPIFLSFPTHQIFQGLFGFSLCLFNTSVPNTTNPITAWTNRAKGPSSLQLRSAVSGSSGMPGKG